MNGVAVGTFDDAYDLESIKEYVIPKLVSKKIAVLDTTPDGREILHNVKPQVEITRKFCPDVRRASSYPDVTNCTDNPTEAELQLLKQRIVNIELKRLLIASVGDTLANKLEKLAKEKAHLSEQVSLLAKQNAADTERVENLVIQGDIWKSKFLAARVVVNELTLWKDTITTKLHDTQQALLKFEDYSKRICYTLHEADRTLATTIVEMDPVIPQNDFVVKRLKKASGYIADLLTNHTMDMVNFNQLSELPDEPPTTPNMYTDTTHYTYAEIPDRLLEETPCNHGLLDNTEHNNLPHNNNIPHNLPHHNSVEHTFFAMSDSDNTSSTSPNLTRSYEACKKSLSFGGCKSCAEKEILHL